MSSNKKTSKVIAVVASLMLVFGLMPLPAFATSDIENQAGPQLASANSGATEGDENAELSDAPENPSEEGAPQTLPSESASTDGDALAEGGSANGEPADEALAIGESADEALADDEPSDGGQAAGQPADDKSAGDKAAGGQSTGKKSMSGQSVAGKSVDDQAVDNTSASTQSFNGGSVGAQSSDSMSAPTSKAVGGNKGSTITTQADSAQATSEDVKIEPHDPYKHAKDSYIRQAWGPNTVLIHCDWEYQFPASFSSKQICQFHDWPLIVMSRPDDYYDGTPKEAYFNWMTMRDYPFGKQYEGFPFDFAEWDGTFTYTGVNGTVEYGPTDKAPIGEGTYYVYAKVRIPSAVTLYSDGTFILGKTFTIEPSAYNVTFDANVPNNASTKVSGTMPTMHFNSRVDTRDLPPNQFILPGYEFDSWNTKEDGSGTRYKNEATVKDLSYGGKDVTLYARWKPKKYTITYKPNGASGSEVTETAVFDLPGKLRAIADLGWTHDNHGFLGWITESIALLFADQEDYVNLGGQPAGYYLDPPNVELIAQWVGNGQIIVAVTKDGVPQEGLGGGFSLISNTGTTFTMPTEYMDGRYVFDPSKAESHGEAPAALPSGKYDLCFEAAAIPGSAGYPESSISIEYDGDSYAISTVFDYYTVSMVKDPAFEDVCEIAMTEGDGASMEADPDAFKANARDGATLNLKTTAEPGYHFDGYSAVGVAPVWEGDDPMKAEQTVEVQGKAEIMAHVAANTYTVHFDKNADGTVIGEMEDQDMVYDEPQDLFANKFVRGGAVFTGWNTKADGGGTAYKDGQNVQNLTTEEDGDVTLYAQWEEAPVKTGLLTFDLGGGTLDGKTGKITVSANVGDVIEMPAAPTREGYTFKYWKGSQYNPGDKYTVEGDHTFTAVWEKAPAPVEKATLTFDLAGGTLDGQTGKVTIEANVGDVIEIPKAPTRKGYTFKYWKGSEYHPGDKYTVEGDHTFTAVWEKNSNGGAANGSSPKTGDEFGGIVVAVSIAAACALCLAVVALIKRRRRNE